MNFVKSNLSYMASLTSVGQYSGTTSGACLANFNAGQFGSAIAVLPKVNATGQWGAVSFMMPPASNGGIPGSATNTAYLKIMSGVIGSTTAIDALTDFPTSSFAAQTLVGGYKTSSSLAQPKYTINFSSSNLAGNSGTATWFLIQFGPAVNTTPGVAAMWGTVGLPGSGADLILNETSIVAGVSYQLPRLTIPLAHHLFSF